MISRCLGDNRIKSPFLGDYRCDLENRGFIAITIQVVLPDTSWFLSLEPWLTMLQGAVQNSSIASSCIHFCPHWTQSGSTIIWKGMPDPLSSFTFWGTPCHCPSIVSFLIKNRYEPFNIISVPIQPRYHFGSFWTSCNDGGDVVIRHNHLWNIFAEF